MELSKNSKLALYTAGSVATGLIVKEIARKSWVAAKGKTPPSDTSNANTSTKDMVMWTVGLAVLGGLGKVFYKKFIPRP